MEINGFAMDWNEYVVDTSCDSSYGKGSIAACDVVIVFPSGRRTVGRVYGWFESGSCSVDKLI